VPPKSDPPGTPPLPDRLRQAAEQANPFLRNEGDTNRVESMSKEQLKADTERHTSRTAEQDRNRSGGQEQGRTRDEDRDRSR
jgi:hypothetical protein